MDPVPQNINWRSVRRLAFFALACTLVGCSLAFFFHSFVTSLLVAVFFAYLLGPFVDWISYRHPQKRAYVCLLLIISLFSVFTVVVASLLPEIYHELTGIIKLLPDVLDFIARKIEPLKDTLASGGRFELETINKAFAEFNLISQVSSQLKGGLEHLWESTPTFLGGMINIALIPVFLFFLLNDMPRIKRGVTLLVPTDLKPALTNFVARMDLTLKSVLKGQLIVAFTLGCLYMAGLSIINLSSALAIGAIAGLCRIVPYLDVVVGVTLGTIVIISQNLGIGMFFGLCLVFLIVQLIDGMLITPRIIGERAGLHPGVVIASILAFGDWFGFFGILIGVPVVAALKVTFNMAMPYYLASPLYKGERRPAVMDGANSLEL